MVYALDTECITVTPRAFYQFPYTDNAIDRPASRAFVREQAVIIQRNSLQPIKTIITAERTQLSPVDTFR
jgi:hypothetical protein